jgi:hypothetical protein
MDRSTRQYEKHDDPKISTLRDEKQNADDSIRINHEFDSIEIDESDLQYEKHDHPRISTLHGISIDSSDEA